MNNSFSLSVPLAPSFSIQQLLYGLVALTCFFLPISISVREVLFVLCLLTIVFQAENRAVIKRLFWTVWGVSITGFVFWVLLSSFWSMAPLKVILNIDIRCVKLLYFPFLVAAFRDEALRNIAIHSLMLAVTLAALLSIFAYFKVPHFTHINPDHVFQTHVVVGFMGASVAYLAACLASQTKTKYRTFYIAVAVITAFQILWVNGGRMGCIMLDCLAVLWMWQYLSWRQMAFALSIYASVCFAAYHFSKVVHTRTQSVATEIQGYSDNTNPNTPIGYRLQFHKFAKELFMAHPILGQGSGAYSASVDEANKFTTQKWGVINDAHGQYWLIAAEQGVIGVMLLFMAFISLIWTIWRIPRVRALALGLLGAMALGQFGDSLLYHSPQIYFFIILLSIYLGEIHENSI